MNAQEVQLAVCCRPFAAYGRGVYSVLVDIGEHPRVRVWDPIGKLYTVCHSLSSRSQARIIEKARKAAGEVRS